MADPFTGEIRIFGFNFAPVNWSSCNGALLAIQQNSTLFSIIGVQFGGNGTSNFGLPNMQGTVPVGAGNGPGLTPRVVGEQMGSATVSLIYNEMPLHNHVINNTNATSNADLVAMPSAGAFLSAESELSPTVSNLKVYSTTPNPNTTLAPTSIAPAGSGLPHDNTQPYQVMNFCICQYGEYPARP